MICDERDLSSGAIFDTSIVISIISAVSLVVTLETLRVVTVLFDDLVGGLLFNLLPLLVRIFVEQLFFDSALTLDTTDFVILLVWGRNFTALEVSSFGLTGSFFGSLLVIVGGLVVGLMVFGAVDLVVATDTAGLVNLKPGREVFTAAGLGTGLVTGFSNF